MLQKYVQKFKESHADCNFIFFMDADMRQLPSVIQDSCISI